MGSFIQQIFNNWNIMRWLRLAMGLFVAYQAFELQNLLLGVLAAFFIFQALANAACCGMNTCNTSPYTQKGSKSEDVEFEEIKSLKE